jgi:hypothetical protein
VIAALRGSTQEGGWIDRRGALGAGSTITLTVRGGRDQARNAASSFVQAFDEARQVSP